MKKVYEDPEMEVVFLEVKEIIMGSGDCTAFSTCGGDCVDIPECVIDGTCIPDTSAI